MNCKDLSNIPSTAYIVWADYGMDGWQPLIYNTLDDALNDVRLGVGGSGWIITHAPIQLVEGLPSDR